LRSSPRSLAQQLLLCYYMATGLLINTLGNNVGTQSPSSEPVATSLKKKSTAVKINNLFSADTNKAVTAYNAQSITQKGPDVKRSNSFSSTLNKKIETKMPQQAQDNKKTEKPDQCSGTHLAQLLMVKESLIVPVKAAGAKIDNQFQQQIESKASDKSVQPVTGSKAAKPIIANPDQIVSATSKPVNKPIQSTIDQSQIKFKIILPDISNKSPIINSQSEKNKDVGKMQVSDNAVVAREKLVNQKSNTATTASTKPAIASEPLSSQQSQQSGKESTPKTLISDNKATADSKQSAVTNKPVAPDSSKTQLSNTPFDAHGNQSSHPQPKVLIGQENLAQASSETAGNKAYASRKDRLGETELSGLLEKGRSRFENPSVKPAAKKTNSPQAQSAVQQVENRSNLPSNNTSKPDMEQGAQIPLSNGTQPGVTEQSPASAAFTKIAGNVNSSPAISGQIQESIQSSLRSGNQQVVIRLNPPELGRVAIKFQEQGTDITGVLEVDKTETRKQIEEALPELIQSLQDSGIQIKKLEVVLTNQQEQNALKDQSSTAGQDNWSGQQSSPNPGSQGNNMTYDDWLTKGGDSIGFAETPETPEMSFAGDSINMLI